MGCESIRRWSDCLDCQDERVNRRNGECHGLCEFRRRSHRKLVRIITLSDFSQGLKPPSLRRRPFRANLPRSGNGIKTGVSTPGSEQHKPSHNEHHTGVPFFAIHFNRPTISPGFGKRPSADFENINLPSTTTSNAPPLPAINVASTPKAFFNSSAKLTARGL